MKKLTAEKCCQLLDSLNSNGMSILEGYYVEALEIALPILEQQEQSEGEWIDWGGGECPVTDDTFVAVKYRNGVVMPYHPAECYIWTHGYYHYLTETSVDIIAYRIIPGWEESCSN